MPHADKKTLTLLLTSRCNLNCSYCYDRYDRQSLGSIDIDLEFARCGIRDHFASGNYSIRYFGIGEPTTRMDMIKELHEYAKNIAIKEGQTLVSELQTNGYMSLEDARWIAHEITNIWVSIDGPPDIHDAHRKNQQGEATSQTIEHNIRLMTDIKRTNNGFIGARPTITSDSNNQQKEIIQYLSNLGIKYIFSDPVCLPVNINQNDVRSLDPIDFVLSFIDAYHYAESLGIFYGNFYMVNYGRPTTIHCRSCIPIPHLTPDGYVSCCDMCTTGNALEPMSACIYGKWNPEKNIIEYNQEQIRFIQHRNLKNLSKCNSCDIMYNCAGGCLGEALNETKSFLGIHDETCRATKLLAKHMDINKPLPVFHP